MPIVITTMISSFVSSTKPTKSQLDFFGKSSIKIHVLVVDNTYNISPMLNGAGIFAIYIYIYHNIHIYIYIAPKSDPFVGKYCIHKLVIF